MAKKGVTTRSRGIGDYDMCRGDGPRVEEKIRSFDTFEGGRRGRTILSSKCGCVLFNFGLIRVIEKTYLIRG